MRCGLCGFLIIKPQTALHHVVWCSAVHYYLQAVLVRFLWFVQFSYYKTVNHTAPCGVVRCGAVHYYLQCSAVMPFCGWFWYDFCGLCCLCGVMNTPTCNNIL